MMKIALKSRHFEKLQRFSLFFRKFKIRANLKNQRKSRRILKKCKHFSISDVENAKTFDENLLKY